MREMGSRCNHVGQSRKDFAGRDIACVTGGKGLVGLRLAHSLSEKGYRVRVLDPKESSTNGKLEIFRGVLDDEAMLRRFLQGADLLFHCAAERRDESKMWATNVEGTRTLVEEVNKSPVSHLCYFSSIAVYGRSHSGIVSEKSRCKPDRVYAESKLAAEKAVRKLKGRIGVTILRPVQIISRSRPASFFKLLTPTAGRRAKHWVKGREHVHIIGLEDVVQAALFLTVRPDTSLESYNVSLDDDPLCTYAGWLAAAKEINKKKGGFVPRLRHPPPLFVPYLIRKYMYRRSFPRDVIYSSGKLLSQGFSFPMGVIGTVSALLKGDASPIF